MVGEGQHLNKHCLSLLLLGNLFAIFIMNSTTDTTPVTKMIQAKH